MKCQNYGPSLGKLAFQLPGDITLSSNLCLMGSIAWSLSVFPKTSFRASKWFWKFMTRKNAKNSKLCCNLKTKWNDGGGSNGIGGWPPISTWIINAPKWLQACRTRKPAKNSKLLEVKSCKNWCRGSKWNRWEATDIHLDHSSLLRKKWSPLR